MGRVQRSNETLRSPSAFYVRREPFGRGERTRHSRYHGRRYALIYLLYEYGLCFLCLAARGIPGVRRPAKTFRRKTSGLAARGKTDADTIGMHQDG